MKKKTKTLILSIVITLILLLTFTVTYALFTYNETGTSNNKLILGDIYMYYNEITNVIDIDDMMPTSSPTDDYFEFQITGRNTNTEGGILYNIELASGDTDNTKTRINPSFLRFRLTEVNGNEETILKDNQQFATLENQIIYTTIIPKNTTNEISKTYRLYMWIDESVVIGNINQDYTIDEWNNLYASVKVNVNGEYTQGEILSEKIKSRLGTEGVVAVNTDGDLYDGTGEIREYRYSGIGNYCTYTDGENDYNISVEGETCPTSVCKYIEQYSGPTFVIGSGDGFIIDETSCKEDGDEEFSLKDNQTTPTDSGLRNYVYFNGELWRIVGVFGDNVKIVKDTPLEKGIYESETYTSGDITYKLKYTYENTKYEYFMYNMTDYNYTGNWSDWTKSGLMHYLNDETGNNYYNTKLSNEAKEMIDSTTYHLGNVTAGYNIDSRMTIQGIAKEVYEQERGTIVCSEDVYEYANQNNCNIWYANQPSWNGKIGLLYPSDYGYASSIENWSKDMSYYSTNGGSLNNWLFNTDAVGSWFLSPTDYSSDTVIEWHINGILFVNSSDTENSSRPVLYLKSDVMTTGGDGSYSRPYILK